MAYMTYTHRDGKLRLYDGTNPRFYLELGFVQVGTKGPLGRPTSVQKGITDRGRITANSHYQEGSDENKLQGVAGPTFSFMLSNTDPNWKKWRQALNIPQDTVWTVGSNTWVTTKGTTSIESGGESPVTVSTPTFTNAPRMRTVHVEVLWNDPTQGGGTGDIGTRWNEVLFEPDKQNIDEQADAVMVSASGMFYGIVEQIVAFSSGTEG